MLHIFTGVINGLEVNKERMLANLNMTGGLVFSQRILLALIDKGVGRQEAYKLVQRNALQISTPDGSSAPVHAHAQEAVYSQQANVSTEPARQNILPFVNVLSNDPEVARYLSVDELKTLTSTDYYIKYIDTAFQRVGL
jgi:adenylosuccinate lyase